MSNSLGPYELYPVRLLCPWGFSRQEYWSGFLYPSPGDLPKPGIEPKSPTLQVSSLPFEPPGKPKHTGVCSLSLLQGIFPTQESNWGLRMDKGFLMVHTEYTQCPWGFDIHHAVIYSHTSASSCDKTHFIAE